MSASCVIMSAETSPVTMFPFGWAEPRGVQPIRPPPPSPSDAGLAPDSPSTQEATPAAAATEYPLSTRYWPIARVLLPLAMSVSTAALPPDEDCAPELAWEVALGDGVAAGAWVGADWAVAAGWGAAVLAGAEGGATVGFAALADRLACGLADREATARLAVLAARIMADAAESTPPTLMPAWVALFRVTGSASSSESWAAWGWPLPATRP